MRKYLVNVSPWILGAACGLLAIIIGVFAVNNYSREKRIMTESLLQKALAVVHFVDTGVRLSLRAYLQNSESNTFDWVAHVQRVLDQIQEIPDVRFVELIDADGKILASSDLEKVGTTIDKGTRQFIEQGKGKDAVYRTYRRTDDEKNSFQLARTYSPRLLRRGPPPQIGGTAVPPRGNYLRGGQGWFRRYQQKIQQLQGKDFSLLVELDLTRFEHAVRGQLLQIVILSVVLLLVGVGGWLSLLTVQGFKGTQSRLRQIRAFNDMLVESLPVGLIATNADRTIRLVNAAAEKIVGVSAVAMVAKPPSQVLPRELADFFMAAQQSVNQPLTGESVVKFNGEKTRTLLLTVLPVGGGEEESVGDVMLLQDMSELRQLESELRRNERLAALGKMAAGVAHELRNPLSSIKGLAVLLKRRLEDDTEGVETADVLVHEVERLNRSISELLDYAKPEQMEKAKISLKDTVEKALTLVRVDTDALGIRVVTDYALDQDQVWADEDRMNQVFLNILLNAMQATGRGGTITIRLFCEGDALCCAFTDSGVGIAEENLTRVFDPYFTTKSDGTGLGLALSAKIVEEHGGAISLESICGEGTTVTVRLPVEQG